MGEGKPRKNPRLKEYDYSAPGFYFVTVNAKERGTDIFAHLVPQKVVRAGHRAGPPSVMLSPIGIIVEQSIKEIDSHYSNVRVDTYAIMPDHVHIIIQIYPVEDGPARCPALTGEREDGPARCPANTRNNLNNENETKPNASLISIMNALKAITAMKAGQRIWQRSFYDHVIRTEEDLYNARRYVKYNASKHFLNQQEGHDTDA